MNTQPHVHHVALAEALTPALRWDGETPIDTHRKVALDESSYMQRLHQILGTEKGGM